MNIPLEVIERGNEIRDTVIRKLIYSFLYGQHPRRLIIDILPEDLSILSLRTDYQFRKTGKINVVVESDTTTPDKWKVAVWDEDGVHGDIELWYSDLVNIIDKGIIVPCITLEYEDLEVPF